jgi:hypothetical protein
MLHCEPSTPAECRIANGITWQPATSRIEKEAPNASADILAFAADKRGYESFPKYMGSVRPLAQRLRRLFNLYGIERVIDVGGNRGQYRSFLRFDMEFSGSHPLDRARS